MRGGLGRIARQSAVYTVGGALGKAGGLVLALIQFNTAYLPLAHYGRLDAAQAVALVLAPALGLGLPAGVLRFVAGGSADDERAAVPFTAFVVALGVAILAVAVGWPVAGWLGRELVLGLDAHTEASIAALAPQAALLARLTLVYAALKSVATVPLLRLQAKERAGAYVLATAGEFALLVAGNYLLLVHLRLGLVGALWALVGSAAFAFAVVSAAMLRAERAVLRWDLVGRLVRFGAPLALAALALPLLHVGDRFVLQRLAPAEALSLYAAANKVAGVLNVLLVQGFQAAFAVVGIKTLDAGGGSDLHRRTFRHLSVGGAGFALGLSLFAFDALALLTPSRSEYLRATPLIFPLAVGLVFYGLYAIGVNALFARGRTRLVAGGVVAAAVLNTALNLALIPRLGAMGAALATACSYAALCVGAARLSERHEGVRFPWRDLAAVLAVAGGLYALALPVMDAPVGLRLAVKAGLLALYPLGVLALGVYRWSEVRAAWAVVRARLRRSG